MSVVCFTLYRHLGSFVQRNVFGLIQSWTKTSLDLFSLGRKRVWTYSVLDDGIPVLMKTGQNLIKTPREWRTFASICNKGHLCWSASIHWTNTWAFSPPPTHTHIYLPMNPLITMHILSLNSLRKFIFWLSKTTYQPSIIFMETNTIPFNLGVHPLSSSRADSLTT